MNAVVAQPAEQCFRKAPVVGSIPTNGSRKGLLHKEDPFSLGNKLGVTTSVVEEPQRLKSSLQIPF